ncbi:MAG TPA: periplasmic heavy metal sensor [Acidobacteriaceae bacterium]|nr:periplasmic heavy metal sensor [Acidobacteriaceae bacterium]
MRIHSKVALALVSLVVSLPLAFGQNGAPAPAPPPPPSQSQAGPNQQYRHRGMHQQQMNRPGPWDRGDMQWGRGNWGRMHHHRDFMLARLANNPTFRERIGMTPEQAQKIRTETFDFQKAQIRNRADVQVKMLELRELLSAQNPDRNAINSKLEEVSAARLVQAKAAINFHLDMRAALTPDQKLKLQEMRKQFFQHRFGPGGPGDGAGPQSGQ